MNTCTEGVLIILEGADGTGTTTQAQLLFNWLLQAHPNTKPILTAEPTDGACGKFIRAVLTRRMQLEVTNRGMAALFYADRTEHFTRVITPALSKGHWVICDRNWQSTLVYQGLTQNQVNAIWIINMHQGLLPLEHYCYILDTPLATARQRREKRSGAAQIYENDPFQACALAAYRDLPKWDWNAKIIPCNSASIDEVQQMIQEKVLRILQSKCYV